ncbi:hypothetical protein GCM10009839_86130 [Catenulispora yoronensis]|uniref:Uncharacterized protein n=1 Tax=Catenulispora yoronensis TaxID=450799 RepID=A0ABP5H3J8_9ACTN
MNTKNAGASANRANPDPTLVCGTADQPTRRAGGFPVRQASTGANVALGDAETALLAGAP